MKPATEPVGKQQLAPVPKWGNTACFRYCVGNTVTALNVYSGTYHGLKITCKATVPPLIFFLLS